MNGKINVVTPRFQMALSLAIFLHAGDVRKGTSIPYIEHLLSVCALVLADGGDEEEAIAALLHDALEDHPREINRKRIKGLFGKRVLAIVKSCTDTPTQYKGGRKPPWGMRKKSYLAHIRRADPSEMRVALADKLHNVRSILADYKEIEEKLWSRFNAGKKKQLWYYRSLVRAFREAGVQSQMLEEFARTVTELEQLVGAPKER